MQLHACGGLTPSLHEVHENGGFDHCVGTKTGPNKP